MTKEEMERALEFLVKKSGFVLTTAVTYERLDRISSYSLDYLGWPLRGGAARFAAGKDFARGV